MSVIVSNSKGDIILICKGADSMIKERLVKVDDLYLKNEEFLTDFANDGLRTLAIANKYISKDEYANWKAKYKVLNLQRMPAMT